MKILITGSTGFLGQHMVKALSSHDVRGVSRTAPHISNPVKFLSTREEELVTWDEKANHYKADLSSDFQVKKVFKHWSPDCVIHLAANPLIKEDKKNPAAIIDDNVKATFNLVNRCPKGCRFLFASSIVAYGTAIEGKSFMEDDYCNPTSMYGVCKLASEGIVNTYTGYGKIHGVNLRACATVGPGLTHGIVYDFERKLRSDSDELDVIGEYPGSCKPFCHVDDLVSAFQLFLDKEVTGTFNVVPDNEISVVEVAEAVMSSLNIYKPLNWLGANANWKGDNPKLSASNSRLKTLGWKPKHWDSMEVIVNRTKSV